MLVSEKNILTSEIEEIVAKLGEGRQALLPILQEIQSRHGHISEFAQQEVARLLDIHPVEVYGFSTFYHFLATKEEG